MKQAEFYTVRDAGEWAFIVVEETTGTFMAHGSFGTYAYTWAHRGPHTLKEFLLDLSFDYFMGKARPSYREFDAERTARGLRDRIIEQRRGRAIEAETAREAWDDIDTYELANIRESQRFFDELYRSDALRAVLAGDYAGLSRETADADSRGFWERIWPKFLEQIAPPAKATAA